mmetsp:Transcript_32874/g.82567  ORF Transcript_32874/g.82567 Transcript_32874/m.82567 type:complete len:1186 (-) Transcript_32874:28-3585(-)
MADYEFDPFDDGSSRRVGERQVQKMQQFASEYGTQLREIGEALDSTLSEVWDPISDPIGLDLTPYEQCGLIELVRTDNKLLNKLMLVFSSLCLECKKLVARARDHFIPVLLIAGHDLKESKLREGNTQVQMGELLPTLTDFSNFVTRCDNVVLNVVRQLASLYHPEQKMYKSSFKGVHMGTVFDHLAELLTVLAILDEVVIQNPALSQAWAMYKRMTKNIRRDPDRYLVEEEELGQFEKLLLSLEGQLFDGLIYQNCVEQMFDFPGVVEVTTNPALLQEFNIYLKATVSRLTTQSGADASLPGYRGHKYMRICAFYGFYWAIFKDPQDPKLFQVLWELNRVYPIMHLAGKAAWISTEFLKKKVPYMVKSMPPQKVKPAEWRDEYRKNLARTFSESVSKYSQDVAVWMVRMESDLASRADLRKTLDARISLLFCGLGLANEISALFHTFKSLHVTMRSPISEANICKLLLLVELLKSIEATYHRRSVLIGETAGLMMQQLSFALQSTLLPLRVALQSNKKYSDAKLDTLASIHLSLQMLNGPSTPARQVLLDLCLHRVLALSAIKDTTLAQVRYYKKQLEILSRLQGEIRDACDTSFMLWNVAMLPVYLQHLFQHPQQAPKLPYMFAALNDCARVIDEARHTDPSKIRDRFCKKVIASLRQEIIARVCDSIEIDLRLHIHSHLKVSDRNPFKKPVQNFAPFVMLKPIRLMDHNIDIRMHVSHHLDTSFYNLTTVAQYNWKTYEEMRNLAKEKYGLDLIQPHLPGQTLEQGLDILMIMRNIHVFVNRYSYNLNNEIFVEKEAEGKFLKTINVQHIANSIRTHGTGIMNTTVNFTYQFLRRKFVIFSQFLYDEHIKGKLYKEARYWKANREKDDNQYPYERADRLVKDIRRLGTTAQGQSYLDQFRKLVTEIGNAMGYIRMVRSGGLSFTSNAIKFVPDLSDIVQFGELCEKEGLSAETIAAAKNLDHCVENMSKNFAEGTQYFRMLVNVFATEFRNESNSHLQQFFLIVPALTLSYVDHMMNLKDKLAKKGGKAGGHFTDDGFAVGIAYILKLLDQEVQFKGLHWFERVLHKYRTEIAASSKEQKNQSTEQERDEDVLASLNLTLLKKSKYLREFELLHYSFSGASVFFKFSEPKQEPIEADAAAAAPVAAAPAQGDNVPVAQADYGYVDQGGEQGMPPPPPPPPGW